MTEVAEQGQPAKPPYISFKSLLNLWDRLGADAFPARIDKSFLESTAGGYATVVIASLRWLDFLHEDGRPTETLKTLVQSPERERKTQFAEILRDKYRGLEDRAKANETQTQFLEYFSDTWGLNGDTRRKAVAFYIAAAKWADVQVGSLWKTPPSGNGTRRSVSGSKTKVEAVEKVAEERQIEADSLVEGLSTALRGVLERLPKFGEEWSSRERDMFKRSFDNVLEWDYPVSDEAPRTSGAETHG